MIARMDGPRFRNLSPSFDDEKKKLGIKHDTGEVFRGLWDAGNARAIEEFERENPGIRQEFETLISMLPDANDPEKSEYPFAASVVLIRDGNMEVLGRSTN